MILNKIALRKYPELDTLRFLSVTLVIGHHLFFQSNAFLQWFYQHGYVGVDIFFTLSGFIITKSLLSEYQKYNTIHFKNFIIRRVLRLWPTWLMTLVVSVMIVFYFGRTNPAIMMSLKTKFWYYLFHFGNYSHAYTGKLHTVFSHFWSLAVEEHFYLLWPSLFLLTRKGKIQSGLIFGTIIIAPYLFRVLHQFQGLPHAINTLSTHTRFDAIAYGCLLAVNFDRLPKISKPISQLSLWTIIFLTFFIGLTLKHSDYNPWIYQLGYSLRAIAAAILIYSLLKTPQNWIRKIWANPFLAKLGMLSYGAYLFHFIMLTFIFKLDQKLHLPQMLIFILAITAIYIPAYLSYRFIELPIDHYKKKFK